MSFEIDVITLFPEMFDAITKYGITGRASKNEIFRLHTWNPRSFARDNYRTVDDSPYGGGPGMIMLAPPLDEAITQAKIRQLSEGINETKVIYLSPQGKLLDHEKVLQLTKLEGMILLCGRYEGIDERIIMRQVDEEISIGNYIISGGELAAMVLVDSIVRQIPGALGSPNSAREDSFSNHLLEFPQYTRPEIYRGDSVPSILLSGDHAKIDRWRLQQSLGKTWLKRPDLLELKYKQGISKEEEELLEEFKRTPNFRIN
ncbi:tRNA (guanosine(37)-N1)-methyltransferase TrmD [Nitrosomonas sp. Nm58]|uniref:tRNA (guanosine(37)-N1)-methyltransferase TrmD n=1 Tax=Nitrosomonas sp. Nm58 TaxID=200126 RepID=UPI000A622C36|nr:tRNA (guanosine(37)-N1)-methyltransferase TrmD [Nitrosomonas sp. Nm58]